jgi:hypothetical protein
MWALIITGIFTAAVHGQALQVDGESLQMLVEMSGDMTISQTGYSSEKACELQLAAISGRHSIIVNGTKMTIHTAECKEDQSEKGKGPKA